MTYSLSTQWFALQVAPKMETRVALALQSKEIEYLLPTYSSKRVWSDRTKVLQIPLFPGYVFCQLAHDAKILAVTTHGVVRIVGFGGKPCPINEEDLVTLQRLSKGEANAVPCPFQQIGQRVRITEGPLSGVTGAIVGSGRKNQLLISIGILMRSVLVDVDPSKVHILAA